MVPICIPSYPSKDEKRPDNGEEIEQEKIMELKFLRFG